MRVIIAGGHKDKRTKLVYGYTDADLDALVALAIEESGFHITVAIVGLASGVDAAGLRWARARGIPIDPHPADWAHKRRAAGPIRNDKMLRVADALVAVHDGLSRGTKDIIIKAMRRGLPHHVKTIPWKESAAGILTPVG